MCPVSAVLLSLGFASIAVMVVVALRLGSICRVQARIEAPGLLVLDLGPCGRLEVPLGSVRAVRRVAELKRCWRLAGIAFPGRLYAGLFRCKGFGNVVIYAERLRDLLLLETVDGSRLLLGWGLEGMAGELERFAGSGPTGRPRLRPNMKPLRVAALLYPVMPALAALTVSAHPAPGVLAAVVILVFTGLLDLLILYALAQEAPGITLLAPPSMLTNIFILASILAQEYLCAGPPS